MHTVLKLAQLRRTGQECLMSDFQRKPSMDNYKREIALKVARRNATKTPSKAFDIPIGSWEQTAQERSKWRGLINKGAAVYEKKRICEAERKRRERKANNNGPPSDFMTLTCSTCNRQFRARIGLVSDQRTHQHGRIYSRNNDGLSH